MTSKDFQNIQEVLQSRFDTKRATYNFEVVMNNNQEGTVKCSLAKASMQEIVTLENSIAVSFLEHKDFDILKWNKGFSAEFKAFSKDYFETIRIQNKS